MYLSFMLLGAYLIGDLSFFLVKAGVFGVVLFLLYQITIMYFIYPHTCDFDLLKSYIMSLNVCYYYRHFLIFCEYYSRIFLQTGEGDEAMTMRVVLLTILS